MKTSKKSASVCKVSITAVLVPSLVFATDIRPRSGSGNKISVGKSANGTVVININAPRNGISRNIYENFDVNGGVILNNGIQAGQSLLGGFVGKNPNLERNSANLIVTEVWSRNTSNIRGAMEVFGSGAKLVFANENGFGIGDVVFFNSKGVTFAGGSLSGNRINVGERSKIAVSGNVQVDGSYFNVIARKIDLMGNVLSTTGKPLKAINFIAGKNEVNIQNPENPSVREQRANYRADSGITGSLVGSMNGDRVKFVTTGRGVGVRHSGAIFVPGDIVINSSGDVDIKSIRTAKANQRGETRGQISISGENVNTTILSGGNVRITSRSNARNRGIIDANNLVVNALRYQNNLGGSTLSFQGINGFDGLATINANSATIVANQVENWGKINVGTLNIRSNTLRNRHEILGENISITLRNNTLENRNGTIAAKRDLLLRAEKPNITFVLEDGRLYGGNMATISTPTPVEIRGKVESPGSIKIRSGNITNNGLLATKGVIDFFVAGGGILRNNGYLYGDSGIRVPNAIRTINNGGIHSRGNIDISSGEIINNGAIFGKNVTLNANRIHNTAQIKGNITKQIEYWTTGRGRVNYGDTAWKRWNSEIILKDIPSFSNGTWLDASSIQASNNININQRMRGGTTINNGWILAGGSVNLGGRVQNITPTNEKRVEDILKTVRSGGIYNDEYLGRWRTRQVSYLKNGNNLLDMLNFMADKRNKAHQREASWNALKSLASGNRALDNLLSLYLGADYKSKRFIPEKNTWKRNAKMIFTPSNGAKIAGRQRVNISGKGLRQGVSSELNNSIAFFSSKFNTSNQSKEYIRNSLERVNYKGLFKESNGIQGGITRKFTSSSNYIDQGDLYGIAYFFERSGSRAGNIVGIGDDYYEYLYLTHQYGGICGGMDKERIKELLENGAQYARQNRGLSIGDKLGVQQIENLSKDMIWYVNIGNGETLLAPVVYLTKDTANKSNFAPTISGGNISINVEDLLSSFGRIEGLDQVSIKTTGTLNVQGSNIVGNSIDVNSGRVNIESINGYVNGAYTTIGQSAVIGAENVNIHANGDLTIKNGIIEGNSSVKLISIGGDIYILNDYGQTSGYQQIDDERNSVGVSNFATNVLSSSVSGGQIAIGSGGNINIVGSNVNGNSNVSMSANNVNIHGASSTTNQHYSSYGSGVQNGLAYTQYGSGESSVTVYNGSNITAEGDLRVNVKGELNVVGSNLTGAEAMDLVAEYLKVTYGQNTTSASQHTTTINALNYNEQGRTEISKTVVGSNINGGDININTQNGAIVGSNINGSGNVSITAENLDLVAAKNQTTTSQKEINIGLSGGASVQLAGNGVGVFLENGQKGTTIISGYEGGVIAGGIKSEVLGDAKVGLKVVVENTNTKTVEHTSSNLSGTNISINVQGKTDIGGGNIKAQENINVISGEIDSTQYVDSVDMSSMKWSVYIQNKTEVTSQLVAAINQQTEQITALTNGEKPNVALSAVAAVTETYNVLTSPIGGATNYLGGGVSVNIGEEHQRTEKNHNISAGGNVNIATTQGNLNLRGSNLSGVDIVVDSNGNIIGRGTTSTSNAKNLSLTAEGNFEQSGTFSTRDGGSFTLGADGAFVAGYSDSSKVSNQNSSWNAQGDLKLKSKGDVVLVGVNASGQTVTLKIDGNLNMQSAIDANKSSSYGAMAVGIAGIGVSSQHIFTGKGTGVADVSHKTNSSSNIASQASINGGVVQGNIGGNLGLKASIISATGMKGNLNIGGVILDESVITHNRTDGARVKLVVTTEGATGGAIDIEDHLGSATKVGNALGVKVNGQETGINTDIENTTSQIKYDAWKGGSINVTPTTKDKLKKLKQRLEGQKSSGEITEDENIHITKL